MIETRGERLWRHAEARGFGLPPVSKRVWFDLVVLHSTGLESRDLRGSCRGRARLGHRLFDLLTTLRKMTHQLD